MSFIRAAGRTALAVGIDPYRMRNLKNLPKYLKQLSSFTKRGGNVTHWYPILSDYDTEAGAATGHYFHQDLLVASMIFDKRPKRHIDIGSRIDGFVAHVASYRKIEVFDIRELSLSAHPNIIFKRRDLMAADIDDKTDSLSCLHTIEHFGLGRYGDPLDPNGHLIGVQNLIAMLAEGGCLYLSFPISDCDQVHFNAHRSFSPESVLSWLPVRNNLRLEEFSYVDDRGDLHLNASVHDVVGANRFGCGIYVFRRVTSVPS